jgi:hypothetical protein
MSGWGWWWCTGYTGAICKSYLGESALREQCPVEWVQGEGWSHSKVCTYIATKHCRGIRNAVALVFHASTNKQTPWSESASELYRPSDRRLSAKWLPTFADKGCHLVSVTDPYGRTLDFSRQEPLLFYQVAPQLYSRGWVDPVPDPLFFFCSAGNRTRASGSVAKNSDHQTTEAASFMPLPDYFQNITSLRPWFVRHWETV